MSLLNLPFILLLTLSTLFSLIFGFVAYRTRKNLPGGISVAVIGLSVAIWSFCYLVEILVPTLNEKIAWANIKQVGNVLLPAATLVFSLRYTQFIKSVNRWLIILLAIEPVLALHFYWTVSDTNFMRIDPVLIHPGSLALLSFQFGVGLYLHFAYSASITVASAVLLLLRYIRSESLYKKQIGYILIGMLVPFLGAFITFTGIIPPYFDSTPLLLGFSFPIMAFGLFRNQFFTLIPVNTHTLLDQLPYGLMVVELAKKERILVLNPVAEKILNISQAEALGRAVKEFIPDWQFLPAKTSSQEKFNISWQDRSYQVIGYRSNGRGNPENTWLMVFQDLTDQQIAEAQLRASEEKYRFLAENASDVIWTVDLEGRFTYISPSVEKVSGFSVEDVMNHSIFDTVTADSHQLVVDQLSKIKGIAQQNLPLEEIQKLTHSRFQLEQPRKDGSTVWTEAEISLLLDRDKNIVGFLGVSRDITEQRQYEKDLLYAHRLAEEKSKQAQEALMREQQLHTITRTISSSMELDTILSDLLRQTLEITGTDETRLGLLSADGNYIHFQYGMNRSESFLLDHKIPRDLKYLSWQIVDHRKGVILTKDQIEPLDGFIVQDFLKLGAFEFMGVPVMSGLTVMGILGVFSKDSQRRFNQFDLTMMESIGSQAGIAIQNAHLFAEVNQLAVTDPLTHLYNRRYFFNLARVELERARRYSHQLSIIMLDIDLFKRVNDSFGHLAGDEVLVALSECVRNTLRQVDLAARYGGEEFVILLPETELDSATTTAKRLCEAIHDLQVSYNGKFISVTVSVGVSSLENQVITDVSKMLDQADQAMYAAKEKGRNQVVTWFEISKN